MPVQEQERTQTSNVNVIESISSIESLEAHGLYRVGLAYGRLVYRFRWLVIAFWLMAILASIPLAAQLSSVLQGGGYISSGSESAHVDAILTGTLHQPPSQVVVVFHSATTSTIDPNYQQEVNTFIRRARAFQDVTGVARGGAGQDGRTTYVTVNFDRDGNIMQQRMASFHTLLPAGDSPASPASAYLTGTPATSNDIAQITQQDVEHAEIFAFPVALLVLLIVFGTLVAAAMPLLLALVAVPVALAVVYGIALHMSMSVFVLNIASIVGMGISIDYSLFMTRRFRDELAAGRSVRGAVAWTVATAGEAILFSGLIVMIGFMGMLLIGAQLMTSIGIGGALVVGTSALAALTLMPALLGVLGHRINALRIPGLSRFTARSGLAGNKDGLLRKDERQAQGGFWHAWAMGVMKRPALVMLVVAVLLVCLGWPIFSITVGSATASALPAGAESRQGLDLLRAQFPQENENPIYIVAQSPAGSSILTPENLARVDTLSAWIAEQPHITGVIALTRLPPALGEPTLSEQQLARLYSSGAYRQNPALAQLVASMSSGNTTLIVARTDAPIDSSSGKALIDKLRAGVHGDTAIPAVGADKAAGGLTVLVGGMQATSLDYNRYLYSTFPHAILFILLATYLLLLVMFRSALLPLKAILMNVLSLSASYGVLVYIFQWGNFSAQLGFTSDGYLDSTIPIVMFCILFGLSMDYEVFLLSRMREEWLRTHNNTQAVARGLEKTAGVITNAALLFIIVCGAFMFTSMVIAKETGLGMTTAVLVDATIIRTLLVPATMRLLGKWNWWLPGRARQLIAADSPGRSKTGPAADWGSRTPS